MSSIGVELQVNGTPIPVDSFTVTGSSAGATGHITAETGMTRLDAAGVDLAGLASGDTGSVPVDLAITQDGVRTQLFSGEYLSATYDYNRRSVSIHARDWAGPLVDQRRVLVNALNGNTGALAPQEEPTDGISTQNKTVSQIVTEIAQQFGLTPDLRLSDDGDPDVGTVFGTTQDTILTTTPTSLWAVLTKLARETGNTVYVTPQKHLVFGAPGAGVKPLTFSYMVNPTPPGANAALSLSVVHNPRRNRTFRVVVLSYDPTSSTLTKGQAYAVGSNFKTTGNATVRSGLWTGAQAQSIFTATTASGDGHKKNNKIPVYTFHVDGLTEAQAQQNAQAIAQDIAKREVIARVKCRCIPGLLPNTPASLTGQISPTFANNRYFVTQYSHHYRLPAGADDGEFSTVMSLLNHQPAGAGEPTSKAGQS